MTSAKYKNRYRIASARATWWSYDWAGAYFITICTKNRQHFFGHVKNEEMILSPVGELAHKFWYEIPNHAHNVELGAFQVMPNHLHGILILNGWMDDHGVGNDSGANSNSRFVSDGDCDCNVDCENADFPGSVGFDETIGRDKACLVSTDGNTGDTGDTDGDFMNDRNGNNATTVSGENHANPANPADSAPKQPPLTIPQKRFRNQGKNTVSSMVGGYESAVTRFAHRAGYTFGWQSRFWDRIIRNDEEYQRINDYIENNPKLWKDDRFYSAC
jgi:REP element-mobilizing transposase RayT